MRATALVPAVAALATWLTAAPIARQASQFYSLEYAIDPAWPRPLPNGWKLGSIGGLAIDRQDHLWVAHHGVATASAPPVLEFDGDGRLVSSWGGPGAGFDWPSFPGGIAIDRDGSVWITAAGPLEPLPADPKPTSALVAGGREDAHVLKFTRTGRFLTQIGKAGEIGTTDSQTRLNRPAAVALDFALRELVVADGGSSQRVVVFDAATASYKRHWVVDEKTIARTRVLAEQGLTGGAVRPFTRLSSIVVTPDSRVYAGDRAYNGIVVRWANGGSFGFVAPDAGGARSVWAMALSDPVASTLFVADGQRGQVLLLDSRTFAVTLTVGRPGLEPGSFQRLGSVAVDSQGNLYTGETHEGARLQRFTRKKMKK